MTTSKKTKAPTFEVDKAGLGKLLERRGKEFILGELFQNAADEDVTKIDMHLVRDPNGSGLALLSVEDDNPEGFADLRHAYTLFAESAKKSDPTKRGRFNLGEKLVIALCKTALISTTKGLIMFDDSGREMADPIRARGSKFEGFIEMTDAEIKSAVSFGHTLLVPEGVTATLNGVELPHRTPLKTFKASLRTEKADDEGRLKPTTRKTDVRVFEAREGEVAHLYEMGIPVVQTGDRFHIDIAQKVPLNTDRDNVPPGFLRDVRTHVLNALYEDLDANAAAEVWVDDALEDEAVTSEAVAAVIEKRYGNKVVLADPSDREAEREASSQGYVVLKGGAFSGEAWKNVKDSGCVLPAGQVTPGRNASIKDAPREFMAPEHWPQPVKEVARFAVELAELMLDVTLEVKIGNDPKWKGEDDHILATWQGTGRNATLMLNYARLGYKWFERGPLSEEVLALLIHEFAHYREGDHLSHRYYAACCSMGAAIVALRDREPSFFEGFAPKEKTKVAA